MVLKWQQYHFLTIISWTIYCQANVVIVTGLSVTDRKMRKRQSLSISLQIKSDTVITKQFKKFFIIFQPHTCMETHIFTSQHVSVMRGKCRMPVTANLRDWIPVLRIPNDPHSQLSVKKKECKVKPEAWVKEACCRLIFKGVILGIIRHFCVFAFVCTFVCVLVLTDWFWSKEKQETSLWLCTEAKWF